MGQERTRAGTASDPVAARYEERRDAFGREREALSRRSAAVTRWRVGIFVAGLAALVWAEAVAGPGPGVAVWSAVLAGVVFAGLVVRHRGLERARARAEALSRINDEAVRRVRREWAVLPEVEAGASAAGHPYAADLDLFGHASLTKLLWAGGTVVGRRRLAEWLLRPADAAEVEQRQQAVRELAPEADLRDELAVRGGGVAPGRVEGMDEFAAWAEEGSWLTRMRWLVWSARLLPAATTGLLAAWALGQAPLSLAAVPLLGGMLLTGLYGRRVHATFTRAFSPERSIRAYSPPLALLADAAFRSPMLVRIRAVLEPDGLAAHEWMRRYERLMALADVRYSAMAYLPIQLLTLWDFHVLVRLERWQRAAGGRVRGWLSALADAEALAALARLAHDNPDWAFPTVADAAEPVLRAQGLAHPLLPAQTRVANDVEIGPRGTFLLVTGSNMSGKSTLLRAVGVNVVLAQAGGPVCAAVLSLPPIRLHTSMRVQDSLEEGLSFFMAELKRLKSIVDAARKEGRVEGRTLLYLLDEILQGTNTAERQIAARRILVHLLERPAIGAVTTHDLALADAPELAAACRPVHFQERVHADGPGPTMTFDYRLRPGVATSTNALKLMEIVGLGVAADATG